MIARPHFPSPNFSSDLPTENTLLQLLQRFYIHIQRKGVVVSHIHVIVTLDSEKINFVKGSYVRCIKYKVNKYVVS